MNTTTDTPLTLEDVERLKLVQKELSAKEEFRDSSFALPSQKQANKKGGVA